jgi:hypothetical protein
MVKCDKYKNEEEVEDKVNKWHTTETGVSLQDFLGFTKEEFLAYIRHDLVYKEDK